MDDFNISGTYKSEKDLIKGWQEEIKRLPASEVFYHGTLEIYSSGALPDIATFCGQCWLALKNEIPGERLIDWNFYEEDIIDFLEKLDYQKVDKKHSDYIFLSSKLTAIKCRKAADLIEGLDYTDLEISVLSFTVNGNRLEIPKDIFIANYSDLKVIMKNFEGKYSKNGFDFPYAAEQVLNRIRNKETTNLKKKFQYFGTQKKEADIVCDLTFDPYLNKKVKILEPSAGQGGIIDSVYDWFEKNAIHIELESITSIEFMSENHQILEQKYKDKKDIELINMDFLKYDKYINYFDYIVANPPFSKGQDIDHFYKMYELCKPNGSITSIMSTGWMYNSGKKYVEFRKWLGLKDSNDEFWLKQASKGHADYIGSRVSKHGYDEPLSIKGFEAGAFKKSGTDTITCVIHLEKRDISGFTSQPVYQNKNEQLSFF
jgi:hypothetical protein